jgi:hypothetical protein
LAHRPSVASSFSGRHRMMRHREDAAVRRRPNCGFLPENTKSCPSLKGNFLSFLDSSLLHHLPPHHHFCLSPSPLFDSRALSHPLPSSQLPAIILVFWAHLPLVQPPSDRAIQVLAGQVSSTPTRLGLALFIKVHFNYTDSCRQLKKNLLFKNVCFS